MARLISLVMFFCLVSSVFAGGFMLKEENDFFAYPHTDRFYTQGLELTYACDAKKDGDTMLRKLFGIRNLIYTPMDISIPTPQPWDRPWAGLTGGTYTEWELTKGEFTTRQWLLGVVGDWSQSDNIQTWFHKVTGSAKPMGWANQIPNEPILNYTWNRFNSIWSVGDIHEWGVDLTRRYGYSAGNAFVNGEGSLLCRAGWNVPADYRMGLIQPTLTYPGAASKFSVYIFGEACGRLVFQNITLGGSLFQDGPSQELTPMVAEERAGAALGLRDLFGSKVDLDLSYSMVFRSKEFVGQEQRAEYGSISISLLKGF